MPDPRYRAAVEVTPEALWSQQGQQVRRTAAQVSAAGADDLALATALRREFPDVDTALLSAVAAQQRLSERAAPRLGPWAHDMVLESTALEQATRRDVARYRAQSLRRRLTQLGLHRSPHVIDLGSGIGVDARALVESGFEVTVTDVDPWRCAAAQFNAALSGEPVHSRTGDVREWDLTGFAAAYVDPARRAAAGPRSAAGRRLRPISNPEQWSPPWSWVQHIAQQMPVVAKVAPGVDRRIAPADSEVEWIDHDGSTVEACVWFAPLAGSASDQLGPVRRATVVSDDPTAAESLTGSGLLPPTIAPMVGHLLIEPASSVIHAELVDELALALNAGRIHVTSSWLTADHLSPTALARAWQVMREFPVSPKALRSALADRGSVTWKTADAAVSADQQAQRVGHQPRRGGTTTTVILTADGRAFDVIPVGTGRK